MGSLVKPITPKFARLIWKAQRADINALYRKVAPFSGRFPTRVYLRAGKWNYVGKPSVNVYKTFKKLILKAPYDYSTVEFDRKTVIYGVKRAGQGAIMHSLYHQQLWNVYHPQMLADVTLSWMGYGTRTLGHRYVIGAEGINGVR